MAIVVEIHLINVENGDATAIAVFDHDGTDKKIISSILIDGGYRNDNLVYEYMAVNGLLKGDKIDMLVITHFHADHFNGLMWAALNPKCIGYLIDPGGGDPGRHKPRHFPNVDSKDYVNIVRLNSR
ncbi:MAG: MBL fold metallo-hydrolase [Rhodospirillaceae bacterium]